MRVLKDQGGYSLVEILIAMSIFAFGLLAMAEMQIVSIKGNGVARTATEASTLVQGKVDELKLLPIGDPSLADLDLLGTTGHGVGGLDEIGVAADHTETVSVLSGREYNLSWNIAENADSTLLIRVIIDWQDSSRSKSFRMDFIRGDLNL